jgi:4-alpha-glucanotransferase
MKVLQFAFDGDAENSYLPEHHEELSVVYTGTHDNDTTLGWWAEQSAEERRKVVAHLLDPTEPMPWALVRLAMSSVATLAVVPAQDLLGLGSESRMNTPGTATGNWSWQAFEDDFDGGLATRLRELVEEHRRLV